MKYEYVSVNYEAKNTVLAVISKHRKLINEYAEKGYRYVGFVPTEVGANGCMRKIDLVFENTNNS